MADVQAFNVYSPMYGEVPALLLVDGSQFSIEGSQLGWLPGYCPTTVTLKSGDGWSVTMPMVKVDGACGDWWAAHYKGAGLTFTVLND